MAGTGNWGWVFARPVYGRHGRQWVKPVPLLALLKRSFFNCSCLLVLDNSARSSVKSRSSNFSVNLHHIPVFPSLSVFLITQSMTSKKRNPDIMHPCGTPDFNVEPASLTSPINYCAFASFIHCLNHSYQFGWNLWYEPIILHRVSLWTLSQAFS